MSGIWSVFEVDYSSRVYSPMTSEIVIVWSLTFKPLKINEPVDSIRRTLKGRSVFKKVNFFFSIDLDAEPL